MGFLGEAANPHHALSRPLRSIERSREGACVFDSAQTRRVQGVTILHGSFTMTHLETPMDTSPYFDLGTGRLRFWVTLDDGHSFGATLSKETLHYRFHGQQDGGDALAVYQANRQCIDDAVKRRVLAGAREPVVLRDPDVS
jgi:hypothetical protein